MVLALSKIGKVAAATTATALIERFGAQRIVFTGVAGGLGTGVRVGDIVVAQDFMQHDFDASPIFPCYELPMYDKTRFGGDTALTAQLLAAARLALADERFRAAYPNAKVHHGLVASGDRFVSGALESAALRAALSASGHEVLAVEMEGAAVAQVCHDYDVSFAAVRTISDRADDSAHVDFPSFVDQVASRYAQMMIKQFLTTL